MGHGDQPSESKCTLVTPPQISPVISNHHRKFCQTRPKQKEGWEWVAWVHLILPPGHPATPGNHGEWYFCRRRKLVVVSGVTGWLGLLNVPMRPPHAAGLEWHENGGHNHNRQKIKWSQNNNKISTTQFFFNSHDSRSNHPQPLQRVWGSSEGYQLIDSFDRIFWFAECVQLSRIPDEKYQC